MVSQQMHQQKEDMQDFNSSEEWLARLLCPWDSPSKNTGEGRHALPQGIFLTQGSNHMSYVSCNGKRFLYH